MANDDKVLSDEDVWGLLGWLGDGLEEMVKRRMRNTGEGLHAAAGAVLLATMWWQKELGEAVEDRGWEAGWGEALGEKELADAEGWVREKGEAVRAVMRTHPPLCLVVSDRVRSLAPGVRGVVTGYREEEDGRVTVVVAQGPSARIRGPVEPGLVEVVGYRGQLTPEWVAGVLG